MVQLVLQVNEDHQAVREDLGPQGPPDRGVSRVSPDLQAVQDQLDPVDRTEDQDPLDQ